MNTIDAIANKALGHDADEYDARSLYIRANDSGKGFFGWHIGSANIGWLYEHMDCAALAAELREEANNC